jgi:sporulation and cell division protein SsgA
MASIRGLITGERLLSDDRHMPVDGDWLPMDADWMWDERDPLVIALRFPAARVTWTIGRQLLAEGLRRKAGRGDVIVGPDGALSCYFWPAAAAARCCASTRPR